MAVLKGIILEDKFVVDAKIGQVPYKYTKLTGHVWCAHPEGKESLSYFKVLSRNEELDCTICKVRIITGRNNQIRIHSAFYGHPLLNDPFYIEGGLVNPIAESLEGSDDEEDFKPQAPVPGDGGYMLHSWKTKFIHPTQENIISLECPPPPTWSRYINA